MEYLLSGLRLDPNKRVNIRQDQLKDNNEKLKPKLNNNKSNNILVDNIVTLNTSSGTRLKKDSDKSTNIVLNKDNGLIPSNFDYEKADKLREEADLERKLIDEEIDYQLKLKEQQLLSKKPNMNRISTRPSTYPQLNVSKIRNTGTSNNVVGNEKPKNTSGSILPKRRVVSLDYINEAKLALNNILNLVDENDRPKSVTDQNIKADKLRIQKAKDQLSKQTDEKIAKDWNELKYKYFKAHKGDLTPMSFNNIVKSSNDYKNQMNNAKSKRYASDPIINVQPSSSSFKSPLPNRILSDPSPQKLNTPAVMVPKKKSPSPKKSPLMNTPQNLRVSPPRPNTAKEPLTNRVQRQNTPTRKPEKIVLKSPQINQQQQQHQQPQPHQHRPHTPHKGIEKASPIRRPVQIQNHPDELFDDANLQKNHVTFGRTNTEPEFLYNNKEEEEEEEEEEEAYDDLHTDAILKEPANFGYSPRKHEIEYPIDDYTNYEFEEDDDEEEEDQNSSEHDTSRLSESDYAIDYEDFMKLQQELNLKSQLIKTLHFELEESEAEINELAHRNRELVERLIEQSDVDVGHVRYRNDVQPQPVQYDDTDNDVYYYDDDTNHDQLNANDIYNYENEYTEEIDIEDLNTTKLLNSDITPRGSIVIHV